MAVWNEWTIQKESGSTICNALSDGHAKIVNENREYMRAVVESLRFMFALMVDESKDLNKKRNKCLLCCAT